MTKTLDQKIAEAESKLARLRKQERSLETGQDHPRRHGPERRAAR